MIITVEEIKSKELENNHNRLHVLSLQFTREMHTLSFKCKPMLISSIFSIELVMIKANIRCSTCSRVDTGAGRLIYL